MTRSPTASSRFALLVILTMAYISGCGSDPTVWYSQGEVRHDLAAFEDNRFRSQPKIAPKPLPLRPNVACAPGCDCMLAKEIVDQLNSTGKFGKIEQMEDKENYREALGSPNGEPPDFSGTEFRHLCEDATAQGFDVVVTCETQNFTTFNASTGEERLVSSTARGAVIDARNKFIIAPIQVVYGQPRVSTSEILSGAKVLALPDAKAPTEQEIHRQYANEVKQVLLGLIDNSTSSGTVHPR